MYVHAVPIHVCMLNYTATNFKILTRFTFRELHLQLHLKVNWEALASLLSQSYKAAIGSHHHVFTSSMWSQPFVSSSFKGEARWCMCCVFWLWRFACFLSRLRYEFVLSSYLLSGAYTSRSVWSSEWWRVVLVSRPHHWLCQKSYLYPNGHPSCREGVWMRIGFFDKTQALLHQCNSLM